MILRRVIQSTLFVDTKNDKDYYIYNGKKGEGIKNNLTVDEVYENLDFVCDEEYVALGVNYFSDLEPMGGVGALDYIVRRDTNEDFYVRDISNSMTSDKASLSVIKEEVKQLNGVVGILNRGV